MLLRDADMLGQTNLQALLLAAVGYALVRFEEAYGLWNERTWGEWLGALSGALYVPLGEARPRASTNDRRRCRRCRQRVGRPVSWAGSCGVEAADDAGLCLRARLTSIARC